MRRLGFLALSVFLACVSTLSQADPYVDFVVDIDRLMIYPINRRMEDAGGIPAHRRLTAQIPYRAADWLEEFVEALIRFPRSRVSFFSADFQPRNELVLKGRRLSNGRTFYQGALQDRGDQNGSLLSYDDLTFLDEARKSHRKDIRKVGKDVDLENAFLIDDSWWAPLEGQHRNLIRPESFWAEYIDDFTSIYHDRADYDRDGAEGELITYFQERNALLYAMGVIDRAFADAKAGRITPVAALAKFHWVSLDPKPAINADLTRDLDLYRRGLKRLKAVNPKVHFSGLPPEITLEGCGDWAYVQGLLRPPPKIAPN